MPAIAGIFELQTIFNRHRVHAFHDALHHGLVLNSYTKHFNARLYQAYKVPATGGGTWSRGLTSPLARGVAPNGDGVSRKNVSHKFGAGNICFNQPNY